MMKKQLLFLVMIILPMVASAAVEIDGIYYNLNSTNNTVEVTKNPNKYRGSVVIPELVNYRNNDYSVTSIGKNAFTDCSDITSITIPKSVTTFGESAFYNCKSLTFVNISDLEIWCNISFNSESANPLRYAHHLYLNGEEIKDLVVPANVTSIRNYAFQGCSGLTSVTIPNNVTSIGESAFDECHGLTSVNISNLEAWCKISFSLYSNPLRYAHHLYLNGEEIKDLVIPNSVTSILDHTFQGCSGLTSVTIQDNVTNIGKRTFKDCSGLTSIPIPDNVTSIGEGAFSGCSGLTSVTIPNSVMSIAAHTFHGCSSLTSVTIPNSVKSINDNAFEGCTSLTTITIPNSVIFLSFYAFCGCTGLTTITIPNSVKGIGKYAFEGCSNLALVTIGNGVSYIRERAFYNCPKLTAVYCYAETVPDTHSKAFDGTPTEKSTLYVPANSVEAYRATWPWSNFNNIVAIGSTPADDLKDYIYEAGVNNNWGTPEQPLYSANRDGIYRGFFYAQEADRSGGKGAFKFTGAFNSWEDGNYGLGHINADGLSGTLIDDENSGNILATPGFYRADVNLGNMTYELTPISSIGIIGPAQPGGWDTDTDLTYNPKTLAWEGTMKLAAEEFKFRANDSWDINWGNIISNLKQDGANLKIDEAGTYFIQFFPLCETKSYATLTLVSDPTPGDGSTTTGKCGETVNYLYDKATQTLTIFGKGAIYDYDNGSNKAPWSSYADEIQKIEIESGITSIGYFAFYKCSGITSLSIPATIGYIGSSAFEDCTSLTSLSLNEGLLSIGGSAFESCIGLKKLTIPSTVNSISINAFKNCKGITDVYCYAETVPDTHFDAFDATPTEKSALHVPANAVEAYRTSWPWSDFKEIVAIEERAPDGIISVKQSDDCNGDYYDLTGRRVLHPRKGLYIRNGKKVILR